MSIKRRDFLKGMLGAIGAGIGVGATKLLPEAVSETQEFYSSEGIFGKPATEVEKEQIHEMAQAFLSDDWQLEIPVNFVFDNATAKRLSEDEAVQETIRAALSQK